MKEIVGVDSVTAVRVLVVLQVRSSRSQRA